MNALAEFKAWGAIGASTPWEKGVLSHVTFSWAEFLYIMVSHPFTYPLTIVTGRLLVEFPDFLKCSNFLTQNETNINAKRHQTRKMEDTKPPYA